MKVLISAYACEPNVGSEQAKAWNYVSELALQGHDVVVLSCGSHHREAVERHASRNGLPRGLRFVWHDVPGQVGPGYVDARGIRQHYVKWQWTARAAAKRILAEEQIDVIHHLTWTVLRWPSFLGGLGPRFIFGPVGGGESAPLRLRHGFPWRGLKFELARDLLNGWGRIDPLVWWSLAQADIVLVTDEATRRSVPPPFRGKTFVWADIYAPSEIQAPRKRGDGPLAVLTVARLEYWKGIHLGLAAFRRLLERVPDSRYTIVGVGPEEGFFRQQAEALGIADKVDMCGRIPHERMPAVYKAHDVLLFPSLHDSAGQAVGEALSQGLPAIVLDRGGPPLAVDASCGEVVPTKGRAREAVVASLAAALLRMHGDPPLWERLSAGARKRAEELSYAVRTRQLADRFYTAASLPEHVLAAGCHAA